MNDAGEVIESLQSVSRNFKTIRSAIEKMDDEQLLEIYERTKDISNLAWYIRALVLGVAHERSKRGDGVVVGLAKEFGIGRRMAEIDIAVYYAFIKDNPDFEPQLPAVFYQAAVRTKAPQEAINMALEKKAERPHYPAAAYIRMLKGEPEREKAPPGVYMLIPVDESLKVLEEEAKMDGHGVTYLYGSDNYRSIGGRLYVEIR